MSHKKINWVIGYPLSHTESPQLHNAIYQALDVNAELEAFANPKLEFLIEKIKSLKTELVAVTMPFKQAVIPYLDFQSPEVQALGAANTLIQREGKLYGYNTDVDGIAYALRNIKWDGQKILILGAGGAARAVAYFLNQHSTKLYWLNRSREKLLDVIQDSGGEVVGGDLFDKISFDFIINTTPIGMYPDIKNSPLPHYAFNSNQIVFDLIYNPIHTEFLNRAEAAGAQVISGLEMFRYQALRQIELWLDRSLDFEKLLR